MSRCLSVVVCLNDKVPHLFFVGFFCPSLYCYQLFSTLKHLFWVFVCLCALAICEISAYEEIVSMYLTFTYHK